MVTAQTSFLCASWHWLKYGQNRTMDREWTWPLAQSKPSTLTFDLWLLTLLVYSMNKMGPRLERILSQQWLRIENDIRPDLKTYFKVTAGHLLKSTLWIKGREIGSRQGFYLQLMFDLDFWHTNSEGHILHYINSKSTVHLSQKVCSC